MAGLIRRTSSKGIAISLQIEVAGSAPDRHRGAGETRVAAAGGRLTWQVIVLWLLPSLTAAGLGVWRLTGPALWADELATWGAVRLSWPQLWQLTDSVDAVLLPYYAAMKVYTAVAGTGTAALRLPAVAAIVGATLVITALGRRLGGDVGGVLAGLLFAVLPVVTRYGQEARPYAVVMFFGALAVLLLLRLLADPGLGRAAGYAVAVAAAGLAHPLSALLLLAGHAVAVAWRQFTPRPLDRRAGWWWLSAATAGAIPALVLMVRGAQQRTQLSWIRLADVDSLQGLPQTVFVSAAVGGMVLVLAVLGTRLGGPAPVLAAAGFVPPALLLVVGSQVPVWVGRYVVIAVPALAVLAGAAVAKAGRLSAVSAVALTALLAYPVHLELREPAGHSQDSAKIAEVIGPRSAPGDVVVFPDSHPSIPWAPRDIYERYLPASRPPDVLRVADQRTDGRFLARECPAAACLGDPPRIWVIRVDTASDPLKDMAPGKRARIGKSYRPVQTWRFPLLAIVLMERSTR